jgi:hypothetical protein
MWYNFLMRNDVVLQWTEGGVLRDGHFKLREFETSDGLVMIDSTVVYSLEFVRRDLNHLYRSDVQIIITSGLRTEEDNAALAARLGWTDDGGQVSRDSRHLPKHGGIAVDLFARRRYGQGWRIIEQSVVGETCRPYFNFVKDDYEDGHVHADNRKD